jgi:O-acetyl-ADP-ribose deacetylase (regulator of RNase III)
VSTGIYGYPIVDATHIALEEVRRFCDAEIGSKVCTPVSSEIYPIDGDAYLA